MSHVQNRDTKFALEFKSSVNVSKKTKDSKKTDFGTCFDREEGSGYARLRGSMPLMSCRRGKRQKDGVRPTNRQGDMQSSAYI